MGDIAGWTLEVMRALGYLGLAFLLALENLFPPIPSEIVLPLAGVLVGAGEFNFWGAVAAATVGSVFGALVLYALGRRGGRPLVLRYGRFLSVDEASLERAEGWFGRYGAAVVLFARVVPLARSIVSIPAGTMRMPLGLFLALTVVGSGVWNIALIQAGTILGENWNVVSEWIGTYSSVVYVLAALAVAAYVVFKFHHFRRRRKSGKSP